MCVQQWRVKSSQSSVVGSVGSWCDSFCSSCFIHFWKMAGYQGDIFPRCKRVCFFSMCSKCVLFSNKVIEIY
ncbi:hypothetical protein Hanom_Chr04g00363431 [Helianthus anomalus]